MSTTTEVSMHHNAVELDGEVADVTMATNGTVACKTCRKWACDHVMRFFQTEMDAPIMWEAICKDVPFNVMAPLFAVDHMGPGYVAPVERYIGHTVLVVPRVGPAGRSAYLRMIVPNEPAVGPAGLTPDLERVAGTTWAKIGVLLEGQGMKHIKYAIGSWVATQIALGETEGIECQSMFHKAMNPRGTLKSKMTEGQWKTILVLRGVCYACWQASESINDDIPRVR